MTKLSCKNFIFFLLSFCLSLKSNAITYNLQECFKLAREKSTQLAINLDLVKQTEYQIQQARAGFLPVLALQASRTQQDESTHPLAQNLLSKSQTTSNINLNQNLFQGFRDLNSVRQRSFLKSGYEWAEKQAQLQLYKDVAQAFYTILIFKSDMALYQEQIESTQLRKVELKEARRSGRARDSDLLIADSSIASLEAAIAKTKSLIISYLQSFTFLTGLPPDVNLVNTINLPKKLKSLDLYLDQIEIRPDLQQSKFNLLAAEEAVQISKSGFYPTLNLNANYYLSRPQELYQGVDWDASLVFSFPFFSGGLTKSQVSEAHILQHSKKLNLRLTEELALQNIKFIYASIESEIDLIAKLSKASDLSYQSYKLILRDNHLGVATNMDVLNALQIWQESKRNLERMKITALLDFVKLQTEAARNDLKEAE